MKRFPIPATLLALGALFALALAAGAAQAESEAAKPMIVKIHADWCGTCTRLNSTMAEVKEKIGGDAVIVVLDVTDREAVAASTAKADELGIRAFFDRYKGKTGTVGVIAADGTTVSVMKGELDPDKYVAALAEAKKEA
jgi:thiol-disulfide isomerase/thioredoxin